MKSLWCMSKLKDMGDINKCPLGSNRGQDGTYSVYSNRTPLNFRGAGGKFQQHNQTYHLNLCIQIKGTSSELEEARSTREEDKFTPSNKPVLLK